MERGQFFDVIDARGHVQLFGHHVVWMGGVGIGGRAQQLACIGLEVKALVNANHGRPMAGVHPLRHGKRESGAPARLQPDGWHARHGGHHIRPRARGIHDGAAPQLPAIGQRHVPGIPLFLQAHHLCLGQHLPAPLAQAAQVALVQRMHVDVSRFGLAHASGHGLGFQARQLGQQRGLVHPFHIGGCRTGIVVGPFEQIQLVWPRHVNHATRREDGVCAKLQRGRVVERTAGARQGLDVGRAIRGHVQRSRAPGGVIAGLRFPLQQQHAAAPVLYKLPGNGSACNTGADDDVVCCLHGLRRCGVVR